jgi:hypothetical protein
MREDVPQDAGRSPFAARPAAEAAYFLDLLGDGHVGLGRHEAAIEAYQQAAEGFRAAGPSARTRCACSRSPTATWPWPSPGTRSVTWTSACRC